MTQFKNEILAGTVLARTDIRSENFVSGSSGWRIQRDGSAEFQDVTVRGDVAANSVDVNNQGVRVVIDPQIFNVGEFRSVINFPSGSSLESSVGTIFHEFEEASDEGGRLVLRPAGIDAVSGLPDHIPEFQIRTSVTENPTFNFACQNTAESPLIFLENGRLFIERTGFGTETMLTIRDFGPVPEPQFDIGFRHSPPSIDPPRLTIAETDSHFNGRFLELAASNSGQPTINPDGETFQIPGFRPEVDDDGTDISVTSSSFVQATTGPSVVFTAPQSGVVSLQWWDEMNFEKTGAGSTITRYMISACRVREGNSIGNGQIVADFEDFGAGTLGSKSGDPDGENGSRVGFRLVSGLTPGDTYHALLGHRLNTTSNIIVAESRNRRLMVRPEP